MAMFQKQYGVLPYFKNTKKNTKKTDLVLITSRTSRQWIMPKGNRILNKSKMATAQQEAYEEAGLIGRLEEKNAMRVTIIRQDREIALTLYPMRVEKMLKLWPECHQRKRIIVPYHKAESMIICPKLRRCLKLWRKTL